MKHSHTHKVLRARPRAPTGKLRVEEAPIRRRDAVKHTHVVLCTSQRSVIADSEQLFVTSTSPTYFPRSFLPKCVCVCVRIEY